MERKNKYLIVFLTIMVIFWRASSGELSEDLKFFGTLALGALLSVCVIIRTVKGD